MMLTQPHPTFHIPKPIQACTQTVPHCCCHQHIVEELIADEDVLWQATSIITPLLARLGGAKLAREIWLGCFLALCGAALIACDQPASSGVLSAAALGLSAGDSTAWSSLYVGM